MKFTFSKLLSLAFALPLVVQAAANTHVLHVRNLGDPLTFDWNRSYTPVEATIVRNLQEGLVAIGNKMTVVPALARKWSVSRDQKTYTFYLEKNVKWSDGVPLKAQDFIDSWKRLLSAEFKGNYAYLLFDIVNAQEFHEGKISDFDRVGVKAINDHTLQVQLRAPIAYWIWIPTFWSTFPIRQDIIKKYGTNWDRPGHMVNLGPYLLESYEPRRKVILTRNPNYYGKRGNIDRIVSALVEDDAAAVELYENNQLDFMTKVSSTDAVKLKSRPDFKRWAEARTAHLDFNPNHPRLTNVSVRKAIAMAIDRNALSKAVEGAYQPASTFIPPGILSYKKHYGIEYNPQKAKLMLQKEGFYSKGQVTLDLVSLGFNDEIIVAKAIKKMLKENLGIEVKVHSYESKKFYSPILNQSGFALLLNRWTADFPDPDNFFSIFLSDSGNNRVSWKNSKYDKLILQARSLADSSKRARIYTQAQNLLQLQEVITLPLYYGKNGALVRTNIQGFAPTPTNSYLFKDFSIK